MDITLNNLPAHFEQDSLTIQEIIQAKNFSFKMLVVKLNGHLVKKDQYVTTVVMDGNNLEIIHLISGG